MSLVLQEKGRLLQLSTRLGKKMALGRWKETRLFSRARS
jgi:hypothetical protein